MIWKLLEFIKGLVSFEQLGQEGEDCWFDFNEVNTITCNCKLASLNFVKISVDCDSQDTVSMTPFDSHLLCAATCVQTLFIIIQVHHIA